MSQHLLSTLLGLPLLAAFVVLFTPRQMVGFIRAFTVFSMLVVFGLSFGLLEGNFGSAAMQFVEKRPLVPAYGITYSVGIDGMSLWLVLLTTFIVPLATYASWTHIDSKVKEYAVSLLVLETAMLGAFFALDLFLFYVFWEAMLLPMFIIIGVWGGPRRVYATIKFFLYTFLGSLLIGTAILLEAGLAFLGLGDPNVMSWGLIISAGRAVLRSAWWICTFPGIAILLTVLGINLIGDGLNEALNPRLRER